MAHSLIQHLSYNLWANERIGHLLMAQRWCCVNHRAEKVAFYLHYQDHISHLGCWGHLVYAGLKGGSLADWPSKTFAGWQSRNASWVYQNLNWTFHFSEREGRRLHESNHCLQKHEGRCLRKRGWRNSFSLGESRLLPSRQVITMLHAAGVTQMVNTDLINWFREQRKNKSYR